MNYRDYRVFGRNGIYHIFNRGVAKQNVFEDESDYTLFLLRLREQVLGIPMAKATQTSYTRKVFQPGLFSVAAYCLMPNHFHLVVRQLGDIPVSELLLRLMTGYSKVFNKKRERVGPVFQDRFKAVTITTDEQLLWLSAYVHQNPKVAGLVTDLSQWQWSSYPDYIGTRAGTLVDQSFILGYPNIGYDRDTYQNFVDSAYEKIKSRKDMEMLFID